MAAPMTYSLNFAAVWRSFDLLLQGLALSLGLAVVAILGRQSHDWLVYFSRYGRHVRDWLAGPIPSLIEGVFHRPGAFSRISQVRSASTLETFRSREVPPM